MKEIVVDTNVFVSALLTPHGFPRSILLKIAHGEFRLVISAPLLLELITAFSKPKLQALVPKRKISDLVSLIHQSARIVKPSMTLHACRDLKDNAVLECALAGKVDAIISGDKDLLELNPFHGISVLSPRDFIFRANVK